MASKRRVALSADDIAAFQPLCEFDLSDKRLERARHVVAGHAQAFRQQHGIDMRTADMGIRYRLDESGDKPEVHMLGTGHPRAPVHVEFGGSGRLGDEQHEWIRLLAERHIDCERIVATGHDPASPPPEAVIADPCLVRAARHAGFEPRELLDAIPAVGEIVIGHGWRVAKGSPRTIAMGSLQAHVRRDVGRITLVRLGLDGGGYEPPNHRERGQVGILTVLRTRLPDTVRDGLRGQPLSRLVDSAALDPGARIRRIGGRGGSLVVRVDGCEGLAPMA